VSENSSAGRGPKGRPTPKRSDARRQRTGPVAPPPQTKREAARRVRERNADRRRAVKQGTLVGDERYLMARDAGPLRRAVRDLVDGRRSPATLLLPAAVLPLLGQLSGNPRVQAACTTLWLAALVLAVADFGTTAARIRRMLRADFPGESRSRGHIGYGLVRVLQLRRFRLPKPQVGPPSLRR